MLTVSTKTKSMRLTPHAAKALLEYRKYKLATTGKAPSINTAVNDLIVGAANIEHDRCWNKAFSVIDQCEMLTFPQREEMFKRLDRAMNSKADQMRQLKELQ